MSIELTDFRGKITRETDAVLESLAQATGRDRAEIAREWLHERALEHIHAASILHRQLRAKGLAGECEGVAGASRGRLRASEGLAGEDEGVHSLKGRNGRRAA